MAFAINEELMKVCESGVSYYKWNWIAGFNKEWEVIINGIHICRIKRGEDQGGMDYLAQPLRWKGSI